MPWFVWVLIGIAILILLGRVFGKEEREEVDVAFKRDVVDPIMREAEADTAYSRERFVSGTMSSAELTKLHKRAQERRLRFESARRQYSDSKNYKGRFQTRLGGKDYWGSASAAADEVEGKLFWDAEDYGDALYRLQSQETAAEWKRMEEDKWAQEIAAQRKRAGEEKWFS